MNFGLVATSLSLLAVTSCGGRTALSPTGPSADPQPLTAAASPAAPTPPAPGPSTPRGRFVSGTVEPLDEEAVPCWADRYPCEVYDFVLAQPGALEVTLTWDGNPRALMVQLYWAGEGLAHEDIAPRTGPSKIHFRRPLMEAARYSLRVVSLEPDKAIPFGLTLTY